VEFPRPYPFMVFENMKKLGISPVHSVVKVSAAVVITAARHIDAFDRIACLVFEVDDTVAGVGEGLNAGTWSVAITDASNYMDISTIDEWEKMVRFDALLRHPASAWDD